MENNKFSVLETSAKADILFGHLQRAKIALGSIGRAPEKVKVFLEDFLKSFETKDNMAGGLRRDIFGEGVEDFLILHKPAKKPNDIKKIKDVAAEFHKALANDSDLQKKIKDGETDIITALIQFAGKNKIYLGTVYVRTFFANYPKEFASDLGNTRTLLDVTFQDFINLRTYLRHPDIQAFINEELRRWPPWERWAVLLERMRRLGLVCEKEYFGFLADAVPDMLTRETPEEPNLGFSKDEIHILNFSRSEYYKIKDDFGSLEGFLLDKKTQKMPLEEKVEVAWKNKDEGLMSEKKMMTRGLKSLLTWLIQDFDIDHVDKDLKKERKELFGANVNDWMKRHHERRAIPYRVRKTAIQFWADPNFLKAIEDKTESIHVQVLRYAITAVSNGYDLGTPSLREFFDMLKDEKVMPKNISPEIKDRFRVKSEISVNDFIDFYSGLSHPLVQKLLKSPQFLKIPKHIRIVYLWEYMKKNDLPIPSGRFDALMSVLPPALGNSGIVKNDFGSVGFNIAVIDAIRNAVLDFEKNEKFITTGVFPGLPTAKKVDAYINKIKAENMSIGIRLEDERISAFLFKLFASIEQGESIHKVLGLEESVAISAKAFPDGMNNGNGVPAEQHVFTLLPADFSRPLDFNGRGSLILENDPKSARKTIVRAAKAIIDVLSKDAKPNSKIVIAYGLYPKDKNFGSYMTRIFEKANPYPFSVQFVQRTQ
ncbi:MAG: hypothetical protein NT079_02040, partial [Candidatus Omnitrophica bacterium]|nr:hypothetical protein [Candidatus Omnitrophota bacterium]